MLAILSPVARVELTLSKELVPLPIPLAPLPRTHIKIAIIIEALAASLPLIVPPLTRILIVIPYVLIRTNVRAKAISHLVLIQ